MVRRFAALGVRLLPFFVLITVAVGCGGNSNLTVVLPTYTPKPTPTPNVVAGTVLLPNRRLARLDPSFFQRLAALGAEEAQALTGNVSPAPDVSVRLVWHHSNGVEDLIGSTVTDAEGHYQIELPQGTDETTCRFMVSVGEGNDGTPPLAGTLTRAFVFSTVDAVDIDFASEAVVRMILAQVSAGSSLCSFSPDTIRATVYAVHNYCPPPPSDCSISGASPQDLNSKAVKTVSAADSIRATLGLPTPTPTNTPSPSPTSTVPPATATPTVPTPIPTATSTTPPPTATRTNTSVPTATPTSVPSATFTRSPLPTATLTNTPLPTATLTNTPLPTATLTNTPLPTVTFTNTPSPTATFTNTPPPTATITNTPQPTATPTTPGAAPQISIGSTSGAPGSVVSVAISLTKNGPNIVTIAPLVFTFDPAVLTFESCTSDASGKNVDAVSPAAGHVSLVVSGGLTTIGDGAIAHCSFTIGSGAPAGPSALTFVAAGMSDANQNEFTATGTSGVVTVTSAPTPTVPPSVPRISIGSASGAAGNVISVAISLTKNGPSIVTIAPLMFTFDPAVLTFGSCTSDTSGKTVDAVSPSTGHVSLVVSGGLTTIGDGAIAHCSFTIAGGAPAGASALSFLAAGMSDANQNDFTATGISGSVTVTATPAPTPTSPPSSVPRITIGSASGAPGSSVTVFISLAMNGPSIVTIAPLVFTFDPAVLTFGSCTSDASGKTVDAVSPSAGHVSMVVSGGLATIGDGTIADCTFTVNNGASLGTSALSFVEAGMSDASQNDFTATGVSGSVTVTTPPTPTATPSGPQIIIGTASGSGGSQVTVSIALHNNGASIVTIAPAVFGFDASVLIFNGCVSDVSGKTIAAVAPSSGHVSLVMWGGLSAFPDGNVADCSFTIINGTPLGASALPFEAAGMSDASQTDITASGTPGSVTVQ